MGCLLRGLGVRIHGIATAVSAQPALLHSRSRSGNGRRLCLSQQLHRPRRIPLCAQAAQGGVRAE
eukprot:10808952-Alexandrium_andersonii.AAC.1